MRFNELITTNTAGPRQTYAVEKAFRRVLSKTEGTVVLSNSGTTVQCMFGSATPEEQANIDRVKEALKGLFISHGNTLTRENHKTITEALGRLALFASDGRPVRDERKTEEQEIEERKERQAVYNRRNAQLEEERTTRQAKEREEQEAVLSNPDYQHLERAATSKKSPHALAAANMKRELKRLYPLQKFSTKSDSYSMGNSVCIHWNDGPTVAEVDAITDKYQYSDFDGMQDMSISRKTGQAFRALFGESKHVSCSRHVSEAIREQVKADFEKNYAPGNLEGWELERHNERECNALICNASFYDKGELIGIVDLKEAEGYPRCPELALAFKETVKPEPEPVKETSTETIEGGSFTIEQHEHTKRGFTMHIVIPSERLAKDRFSTLLTSAKEAGGWYSRAWQGTPGGFAFKDQEKAEAFAAEAFGTSWVPKDIDPLGDLNELKSAPLEEPEGVQLDLFGKKVTMYRQEVRGVSMPPNPPSILPEDSKLVQDRLNGDRWQWKIQGEGGLWFDFGESFETKAEAQKYYLLPPPPTGRTSPAPVFQQPKSTDFKPSPSLPAKFREQADKMQTAIDDAFAPLSQNPTPKRLHQQQGKRLKGEDLERAQTAFRSMADAIEGDCLPVELRGVKSKAEVLRLVSQGARNTDYYTTIGTGEYKDQTPEGKALQGLIEDAQTPDPEREKKQELEKLEHEVSLTKIPGFFPTPKAVAERMAEMAEISEGDTVLEPSAGTGRLAEAARDAGASTIHCFEVDRRLSRILELKGFSVEREDCTEADILPCYDAVIMNPPFEKRQDAEHVRLAYSLLKEGGRLCAIMGEGVFFGKDSKASAFRGWLDSVGGTSEKLPEGTFKETGTGVNSRLVFVQK